MAKQLRCDRAHRSEVVALHFPFEKNIKNVIFGQTVKEEKKTAAKKKKKKKTKKKNKQTKKH